MAPQVGLEPTTLRLTAGCSAIELLRSVECSARGTRAALWAYFLVYHSIQLRGLEISAEGGNIVLRFGDVVLVRCCFLLGPFSGGLVCLRCL
jgi:hypothetical protein